jgi:hypothetical protein
MAQGESHYQDGTESPLKALFLSSSKGIREEFLLWVTDRYPEFICLLLRRTGKSVKCEEAKT